MKTLSNEVSYEEFISMSKDEIYHFAYNRIMRKIGFSDFLKWAIEKLFKDPETLWEFFNMKAPPLSREEEVEFRR